MYALVKNNTIVNVYASAPQVFDKDVKIMPVIDDRPNYDSRIQNLIPPASVKNAPQKYAIAGDNVIRKFTIEDIPLDALKAKKKEELTAFFHTKMNSPFKWRDCYFDNTPQFRESIGRYSLLFLPENFYWRNLANEKVPMTQDDFLDFAATANSHIHLLYDKYWMHKDAIMTLDTPMRVISYDTEQGW